MYSSLLFLHSAFRWIVLLSLFYGITKGFRGYIFKRKFSSWDNRVRHWTATIAHIQLILGIVLYLKSPVIHYFLNNFSEAINNIDNTFFGMIHGILMLCAIITITIGSALSKRKEVDSEKFKIMALWFSVALLIIVIAIPWPFSPFASRPYFR